MERIPEYCKVGLVTGVGTVVNCGLFALLSSFPLSAPVVMASKVYLIAFPAIGLTATTKKMYDYVKSPQSWKKIQEHAD